MDTKYKKQQLLSLDILKGIAIIMIIIVHNRHFLLDHTDGYRQLINFCQMGCQLFFLISGLSLCYSWDSHDVSANTSWIHKSISFIKRRYKRIVPGFLFILLLNLLLNIVLIDIFNYSPGYVMNREPKGLLVNIFLLHGFSPSYINNVFPGGWYIGTACIFYLLFPFIITIFSKMYSVNKRSIAILPILFFFLNYLLISSINDLSDGKYYPFNNTFMYYFFTNHLTCISLGILLYFQEKEHFCQKCPIIVSFSLFIILIFKCIQLYIKPDNNNTFIILPSLVGFSFYWLAITMIHLEHKREHSTPASMNKDDIVISYFMKFLASCGKHSYGIYLTHSFVCWYGMKMLTDFLAPYKYNDLRLYFVMLIPSVLLSYTLGIYIDLFFKAILSRKNSVCQRTHYAYYISSTFLTNKKE